MKRKLILYFLLPCFIAVSIISVYLIHQRLNRSEKQLTIMYPIKGMLFPPEFPAPTFFWTDPIPNSREWEVELFVKNKSFHLTIITNKPEWKPDKIQWDSVKSISKHDKIFFRVQRNGVQVKKNRFARDENFFSISTDSVGAPIMYRDIPLPFAYAEQHPEMMSYRLVNAGSDSSPHYAMKKFMVCGNCHSFSANGSLMGSDFDAAKRDKGGYFIADVKDTMIFDTSNYLSWNKVQDSKTFGMLSKVSPSGRYVATTIKDRVVSHSYGYGHDVMAFSQLFFPVNGVLAVYDRQTGKIKELPGANLKEYVQSNAYWTPDEKNIVFSRAKALDFTEDPYDIKVYDEQLIDEFVTRKRDFKFEICIIPFNKGNGGLAKPIKGASNNGESNYFPTVSPDGKWLVFCKADNFMLLQPDSRMYIVPLKGGKARKMKCNMYLMNSWHAWSPNGKWMVFSSKGFSIYTDLFLTHIDGDGNSSYPVLIETVHQEGRAANYPEFLNSKTDFTPTMIYKYVNLDHITTAMIGKDTALAISLYDQFIEQGQFSLIDEYLFLAQFNYELKHYGEAVRILEIALKNNPGNKQIIELLEMIKSKMH